ncbi:MAG: YkgJ family cysteine cluster protein [Methanomicrobia archaeon]|nr:YkgJ family cysteine cluster protein [Candidatus Aenigmarchaeota archaeon]MCK4432757.1 YkgJ family cysteine cluster protein [Methanomicrobia archaeon]
MKFGCDTCDNCGLCCKDWDIELSKEDIRTIIGLGYDPKNFLVLDPVPRMRMVKRKDEKSCLFLDRKDMCILERRHGHEAKPHTCRQYPEIKTERIKEKDYFFYEYGGKVFARDILVKMLGNLKRTSKAYLFEMLLDELGMLRKQGNRYVDVFNYDDAKKSSRIRKSLMRRRVRNILLEKFREEDMEEFNKIEKRKKLNVQDMMEEIQKRIPGEDALNPNLPEMLLAYFYIVQTHENNDPKRLAEYFFEWNSKRF